MTDQKFTDAETVKALECCNTPGSCSECPYYVINEVEYDDMCIQNLIIDILPLINRQKSEIERLQAVHADMTESLRLASEANKDMQAENEEQHQAIINALKRMGEIRAEAIKEFAENVKAIFECVLYFDDDVKECILNEIDALVEEMTEDNNESQNT